MSWCPSEGLEEQKKKKKEGLEEKALDGARQICGEGDGTPLQYSCLENPMDGGAW